jgi:hypothetical protein
MFATARQFIRSLQRSNDERKKRWLVGTSAVTMALVVILWLGYLNVIVPVLSPRESIGIAAVVAPNTEKDGSLFATLGRGFSVVGESMKTSWDGMVGKVVPLYDSIRQRLEPTPTTLVPGETTVPQTP